MNERFRLGRRRWLQLLSTAAFGAGGASVLISNALAKGDAPPGIHRLEGTARVNGKPASVGTPVAVGDRVSTGPQSQAVVILGGDAFLLRADTNLELQGGGGVLSGLVVGTGKVLSVFSKKPLAIKASGATIGIRGTGTYIEVDPEGVYFCLCYGEASIDGAGMPTRMVKTTHHEEPLLLRSVGGALRAEPGPFRNHSDMELTLLEAAVGREPPFKKEGAAYPLKPY